MLLNSRLTFTHNYLLLSRWWPVSHNCHGQRTLQNTQPKRSLQCTVSWMCFVATRSWDTTLQLLLKPSSMSQLHTKHKQTFGLHDACAYSCLWLLKDAVPSCAYLNKSDSFKGVSSQFILAPDVTNLSVGLLWKYPSISCSISKASLFLERRFRLVK